MPTPQGIPESTSPADSRSSADRLSTADSLSTAEGLPAQRERVSPEQTQVKISIGSRYDHIDLIQIVVDDALARLGLDDDARHWVGIAIREAVANAIKHGNRQDPGKEVDVELAVAGDEAVIRVHDRGEGFEPEKVADPLTDENRMRTSGRGIFYMKSFMDDIQYLPRPEGGTMVVMRKRLTPGTPSA